MPPKHKTLAPSPKPRPCGVTSLTPQNEVRPFASVSGTAPNETGEPCVTVNYWLGGRISGIGLRMTPAEARSLAENLVAFANRAEGKS